MDRGSVGGTGESEICDPCGFCDPAPHVSGGHGGTGRALLLQAHLPCRHAGGRFAAVLLMIAFFLTCSRTKLEVYFYTTSFFIIAIFGNMIARTTTIGVILSILYWIYDILKGKQNLFEVYTGNMYVCHSCNGYPL